MRTAIRSFAGILLDAVVNAETANGRMKQITPSGSIVFKKNVIIHWPHRPPTVSPAAASRPLIPHWAFQLSPAHGIHFAPYSPQRGESHRRYALAAARSRRSFPSVYGCHQNRRLAKRLGWALTDRSRTASWSDAHENKDPHPASPHPPQGNDGSPKLVSFSQTIADGACRARDMAARRLRDQIETPSGRQQLAARRIPCSGPSATATARTGPNTSSWKSAASVDPPVTMIQGTARRPISDGESCPPRSTVPPLSHASSTAVRS